MKDINKHRPRASAAMRDTGMVLGRSLFPICALALLASSMLWGPWGLLIGAALWWKLITRIA